MMQVHVDHYLVPAPVPFKGSGKRSTDSSDQACKQAPHMKKPAIEAGFP
jgi:hypothetical protein